MNYLCYCKNYKQDDYRWFKASLKLLRELEYITFFGITVYKDKNSYKNELEKKLFRAPKRMIKFPMLFFYVLPATTTKKEWLLNFFFGNTLEYLGESISLLNISTPRYFNF